MDLHSVMQHQQQAGTSQGPSAPQKVVHAVVLENVSVPGLPIRCKDRETNLEFVALHWSISSWTSLR